MDYFPDERLASEVLVIRVLDPPGDNCLVRKIEGMLEIHEPRDQAWRCRWPTLMRGEETCPFPFEEILVDQCSELHQLMAGIDHVDQSRSEQVILSGTREWGLEVDPPGETVWRLG